MIPKRYVDEWRQSVEWIDNSQVEQDLIITRALVAIYSDEFLKSRLAFRGGTALHKLFAKPPARYSEDIDLVQITPAPIGEVLSKLRNVLSFIEGPKANIDKGEAMTTMHFRYFSEENPVRKMKLKVEINCREHLVVYGLKKVNIDISNSWYKGNAQITTYEPEELLGTKLRALYQRRKGRDLFDLWYALTKLELNPEKIINAFYQYTQATNTKISKIDFLTNMESKIKNADFRNDTAGLISSKIAYNIDDAYDIVTKLLLIHFKF